MNPLHNPPEVRRGLSLRDMPATYGETMGNIGSMGWEYNPLQEVKGIWSRAKMRQSDDRISPKEAADRFTAAGIPDAIGDIPKNYTSVSRPWVEELERLADERAKRDFAMSRAQGGFLEGLSGFGVMLATSVIDPINVGLSIIPPVGYARYSMALGRASSAWGRAGVRAAYGGSAGAMGSTMAEGIILYGEAQKHSDYTYLNSLLNIAVGTVLGGGLHMGAGAVMDRYKHLRTTTEQTVPDDVVMARAADTSQPAGAIPDRIADWTVTEREAVLRSALVQAERGYVDIDDLVAIIEARRAGIADMPRTQRQEFIERNIKQMDEAISLQEARGAPLTPEMIASIEAKISDSPARIKAKTKELQKGRKKFKEAQKEARAVINEENASMSRELNKAKKESEFEAATLDRARREVASLRQGNIPERLRSQLPRLQIERPGYGDVSPAWSTDLTAPQLRQHLEALKAQAERPDHMLGRHTDDHISNQEQVAAMPKEKETPDEILEDIAELQKEFPDVDTVQLDAEIRTMAAERTPILQAAACIARTML